MTRRHYDREHLLANLRHVLRGHQGPDNTISMRDAFEAITGEVVIPGRRYDQTRIVRSLVEQLRREGVPVGFRGGPDGGYFVARSDEELAETLAIFHARALSSFRQEAALKRITFGELLEQYALELHDPPSDTEVTTP